MRALLASLTTRRLTDRERPILLLAVIAALVASALALAATPAERTTHHRPRAAYHAPSVPRARARVSSAAARRVSKTFLAGYLSYLYGHGPASAVRDAAPVLARALAAHPPRVSPAMQAAHPRVLALESIGSSGLVTLAALINDGSLIDYRIELQLIDRDGQLQVGAVESD